jgi:hypothetical protein
MKKDAQRTHPTRTSWIAGSSATVNVPRNFAVSSAVDELMVAMPVPFKHTTTETLIVANRQFMRRIVTSKTPCGQAVCRLPDGSACAPSLLC